MSRASSVENPAMNGSAGNGCASTPPSLSSSYASIEMRLRTVSVFTVLSRISIEAYDELSDGGVEAQPLPADPFIAGFSTELARDILVKEFDHATELGGSVDYDLISGADLRVLEPLLAEGTTDGILIKGQRFINPGEYVN